MGAVWLGLLLFFGALPKHIVHEFAGHHDTWHSANFGHEGPVIEQEHHHCDFVDFALTPFAHISFSFEPVFQPRPYFTYFDAPVTGHPSFPVLYTSLRGPPAA